MVAVYNFLRGCPYIPSQSPRSLPRVILTLPPSSPLPSPPPPTSTPLYCSALASRATLPALATPSSTHPLLLAFSRARNVRRFSAAASASWGSPSSPSSPLAPLAPPSARREQVLKAVQAEVLSRDDAFYVVDLSELAHKYKEWCTQLPRARPFYAVKCNDDPQVLAQLARLGCGFDCASKGEMEAVLALGVPPTDIIYAHPAKPISHLRYAASVGVTRLTFDNEDELEKIAAHHPGAHCVLRILADDTHSVCRLGLKFGAALPAVPALVAKAKSLGLALVGVSYHVGSGNGDAASFAAAVKDARATFDIAASQGITMTLLDLGGGYPGSDLGADLGATAAAASASASAATTTTAGNPYASHPTFRTITSHMRKALDEHFPVGCGVEVIGEPGRFFVKSTMTLAVRVVGKKRTVDEESAAAATTTTTTPLPRLNYYVNDGLYGSFNCNVYDHAQPMPSLLLTSPALSSNIATAAVATASSALTVRSLEPAHLLALEASELLSGVSHPDTIAILNADGTATPLDALGVSHAAALSAAASHRQHRASTPSSSSSVEEGEAVRRVMVMGGGDGGRQGEEEEGGGSGGGSSHLSANSGLQLHKQQQQQQVYQQQRQQQQSSSSSSSSPSLSWPKGASTPSSTPTPSPTPKRKHTLFPTTLWGPTCDSFDKLSDSVRLPELNNGDWIVYENMGAYTVAGACTFNGFPLPNKVYLNKV